MVLILTALLGCSAKNAVVQAPTAIDVSLAAARNNLDDRQVFTVPDPLLERITAQLTARNLTPSVVPLSAPRRSCATSAVLSVAPRPSCTMKIW